MQQLIQRITEKTGVTPEQAELVLEVVAGFVKEKFPLLHGNVDSILGTKSSVKGNSFVSNQHN